MRDLCIAVGCLCCLTGTAAAEERPRALVPLYASFVTLQALDVYTTDLALSRGAREFNPLVPVDHLPTFVTFKAAGTAAIVHLTEQAWRMGDRRGAVVAQIVSNALMAVVVVNNWIVAERQQAFLDGSTKKARSGDQVSVAAFTVTW